MPHTPNDASSTIDGRDRRGRPVLGFARAARVDPRPLSGRAALARVGSAASAQADIEPTVAVIIAAYNEETVIARRLDNLLELDYPREKLQIVVSSDASSDRTEEIALQYPGVQVIPNPRGGKVAAQDRAVRQSDDEIVAFSDANCTWSPDALRKLVRSFADPDVAYVCGQLRLLEPTARTRRARTGGTRWPCARPSRSLPP